MKKYFLVKIFCGLSVFLFYTSTGYSATYFDIEKKMLGNNISLYNQKVILRTLLKKKNSLYSEITAPSLNMKVANISENSTLAGSAPGFILGYKQDIIVFNKFDYQKQIVDIDIKIARLKLQNLKDLLRKNMCLDLYNLKNVLMILDVLNNNMDVLVKAYKVINLKNTSLGIRDVVQMHRTLSNVSELHMQLESRKMDLYDKISRTYDLQPEEIGAVRFIIAPQVLKDIVKDNIYNFQGILDQLQYDRNIKQLKVNKGNFAALSVQLDENLSKSGTSTNVAFNLSVPLYSADANVYLAREKQKTAIIYRKARKKNIFDMNNTKDILLKKIEMLDVLYKKLHVIFSASKQLYEANKDDSRETSLNDKLSALYNYISDLDKINANRLQYMNNFFTLRMLYNKNTFCR